MKRGLDSLAAPAGEGVQVLWSWEVSAVYGPGFSAAPTWSYTKHLNLSYVIIIFLIAGWGDWRVGSWTETTSGRSGMGSHSSQDSLKSSVITVLRTPMASSEL